MRRANRWRGLPEKSSSPQLSRVRSAGAETFSSWRAQADLSTGPLANPLLELKALLTLCWCPRSSCYGTHHLLRPAKRQTTSTRISSDILACKYSVRRSYRTDRQNFTSASPQPDNVPHRIRAGFSCIIEARHAHIFSSETLRILGSAMFRSCCVGTTSLLS